MMDRATDGIVRFNTGVYCQYRKRRYILRHKGMAAFRRVGLLIWLTFVLPIVIPAIILLQSSIWIGILSEGTLSNSLVSDLEVGMGEACSKRMARQPQSLGLASIPSDDEFRYRHAASSDILVIQFRHHLRASARIVGDVPHMF